MLEPFPTHLPFFELGKIISVQYLNLKLAKTKIETDLAGKYTRR